MFYCPQSKNLSASQPQTDVLSHLQSSYWVWIAVGLGWYSISLHLHCHIPAEAHKRHRLNCDGFMNVCLWNEWAVGSSYPAPASIWRTFRAASAACCLANFLLAPWPAKTKHLYIYSLIFTVHEINKLTWAAVVPQNALTVLPVHDTSPNLTLKTKLGWWASPSAFSSTYTGRLPHLMPCSCRIWMGVLLAIVFCGGSGFFWLLM